MTNFSQEQSQLRGLAAAERASIDLVDLTDFDVQIALSENNGVQFYEVLNIVTQFMIESFQSCFDDNEGTRAEFDTIILLERTRRRQLEALERELDSTCCVACSIFLTERIKIEQYSTSFCVLYSMMFSLLQPLPLIK